MATDTNTRYGRRKLGDEVFEAQQAKKKVTTASGNVYGPRKQGANPAPAQNTSGAFSELKAGLHQNDTAWARERIATLTDPKEVAAVHALESTHPKYQGGRKGVLDALEERKGELAIAASGGDPNPGQARGPRPEEGEEGEETDTGETGEEPAGRLDVDALRAQLEEDPAALDALIDAEFAEGPPRPEAIELFRSTEEAKDEPREAVLNLLTPPETE